MPVIHTDEKTFQIKFYEALFGINNLEGHIRIDRNTDGYTNGIIFEHKTNVISYGRSKALSQALIYLSRFNLQGYPVPGKIMLICQESQIAYLYDANEYSDIINDTSSYAQSKASVGIEGFTERTAPKEIRFDINSAQGMLDILNEINAVPTYVKVSIDVHNVYGWSDYYYKNAERYGQKPEKKKFFEELKNPSGTLVRFIQPWQGHESDFTYIMDLLNDPMTQKKLGAFYTPIQYCELAHELLKKAIERVPDGNDYVILDRCAGTGNLEEVLTDEELSHVIISTYELKEWYVLKDRIGKRVRYLIPPIPVPPKNLPDLNGEGFLSGANALDEEFINSIKAAIEATKTKEKVTVILYENPPYVETTSIEFQRNQDENNSQNSWKNTYVVNEMKKEISGTTSNDMGNAFIWSGFKYFLKEKTDSYILFSPAKYWKAQHLINKKFIDGFAVNRSFFHAPTPACIMLILWSNEDANLEEIELKAKNLDNDGEYLDEGIIKVKRIHSIYSDRFYDNRRDSNDKFDGIICELNGKESFRSTSSVSKAYNENILGYMVAKTSGFDNPRLSSNFLIAGKYDGHGFYVRNDNFLEKLPIFAATRYTDNQNDWKIMSMVMKSADKAEEYLDDIKKGKLRDFLCKCLIWVSLSHYPHMRSLKGSDGRTYINQLCLDDDTLASKTLREFIVNGYVLTVEDENLLNDWETIIKRVRQKYNNGQYRYPYNSSMNQGYNPEYKYGLYQIDEEVNYKIDSAPDSNGKTHKIPNDGDLNNMIKSFKKKLKDYYLNNIVDYLFKYELLK